MKYIVQSIFNGKVQNLQDVYLHKLSWKKNAVWIIRRAPKNAKNIFKFAIPQKSCEFKRLKFSQTQEDAGLSHYGVKNDLKLGNVTLGRVNREK